jgi:hypothetical protein
VPCTPSSPPTLAPIPVVSVPSVVQNQILLTMEETENEISRTASALETNCPSIKEVPDPVPFSRFQMQADRLSQGLCP